jgi:hypothetical protein
VGVWRERACGKPVTATPCHRASSPPHSQKTKKKLSIPTCARKKNNSEKSPDELRQLVSDVFGKVSPVVGMKDISTEVGGCTRPIQCLML